MEEKEYWEKLNEEYNAFSFRTDLENMSNLEIQKLFDEHAKQHQVLLNKYGTSAWYIFRFFELCCAEKISEGKFRELTRYQLDKTVKQSMQRLLKDLKNKYSSHLAEVQTKKMDKTVDECKVIELVAKIEVLNEVLNKL